MNSAKTDSNANVSNQNELFVCYVRARKIYRVLRGQGYGSVRTKVNTKEKTNMESS